MKGIVLAGGKSSRFGENKALARFGDTTLLELAVNKIREINLDPIVIANPRYDYSFLDCPVWHDALPDKGPLGGIYTACQRLKHEAFLVLTCDMPAVSLGALKHLLEQELETNDVVIYVNESKPEPFPGIYSGGLEALIFERLKNDRHSMMDFLKDYPRVRMMQSMSYEDVFLNVNEKTDLDKWGLR